MRHGIREVWKAASGGECVGIREGCGQAPKSPTRGRALPTPARAGKAEAKPKAKSLAKSKAAPKAKSLAKSKAAPKAVAKTQAKSKAAPKAKAKQVKMDYNNRYSRAYHKAIREGRGKEEARFSNLMIYVCRRLPKRGSLLLQVGALRWFKYGYY